MPDVLRFTPELLSKPHLSGIDAVTTLRHFSIVTYAVEPDALKKHLHPRFSQAGVGPNRSSSFSEGPGCHSSLKREEPLGYPSSRHRMPTPRAPFALEEFRVVPIVTHLVSTIRSAAPTPAATARGGESTAGRERWGTSRRVSWAKIVHGLVQIVLCLRYTAPLPPQTL